MLLGPIQNPTISNLPQISKQIRYTIKNYFAYFNLTAVLCLLFSNAKPKITAANEAFTRIPLQVTHHQR
jgi:hypothetical protein